MPRVVRGRPPTATVYQTAWGRLLHGKSEDVLVSRAVQRLRGKVQLVLTSPPFPLNRQKAYGNETGEAYKRWLRSFSLIFLDLLTDDGSIVVEVGNSWEPGSPTMSTLAIESLLEFKKAGDLHLCQEVIWHNTAKLPTPAQWVNIERIRIKDSFTRFWWLSASPRPKADNRRVLTEYSASMKQLLRTRKYNAGTRPSEHHIGRTSFLKDNGGAIPGSVISCSNTHGDEKYQRFCRTHGIKRHPARMPLEVADFFVHMLTEDGDIVVDPFAGSNTTGRAAQSSGRQWLSVEAESAYAIGSSARFDDARVIDRDFFRELGFHEDR